MFLNGEYIATIQHIQIVDIHGTHYVDLVLTLAGENTPRTARIGKDDIYAHPQPGDSVRLIYIMNILTGVQRANT